MLTKTEDRVGRDTRAVPMRHGRRFGGRSLGLALVLLWACSPSDAPGRSAPDAGPRDPDDQREEDASDGPHDPADGGSDGPGPGEPRDGGGDAPPGDASGPDDVHTARSHQALERLREHLTKPRATRGAIAEQPFAEVPLTREDAEAAGTALWEEFAAWVRATRQAEWGATETQAKTISEAGHSLRYYLARTGDDPPGGRSLFISMHGGGNASAATNDGQWRNQIALVDGYAPENAVWIAPRAPIDDWNMWFVEEIDALFEHLITDAIVFEGVNPDKVYLNGYSAGGDGVYQLGPRMAERWAGAGMSAGHPNDSTPVNLRNVAFAIHVGGDDSAYDRNLVAAQWGMQLEQLAADDPDGYANQWQVHAGLPHWMDLEDAVSIPFLQAHTRDPMPPRVVWKQVGVTRPHFYWLAVDADNQRKDTEIRAHIAGDTVSIESAVGLTRVTIRGSDALLDLDRPVRVEQAGNTLFAGKLARTIAVLDRTLQEREDPRMLFSTEVVVTLP